MRMDGEKDEFLFLKSCLYLFLWDGWLATGLANDKQIIGVQYGRWCNRQFS